MRKIALSVMVLILAVVFCGVALAEKPETPKTIKGAKVVGDEWVKANYKNYKIYDVRKKAEYVEGHIPGAISAPYKEKSAKSVDFDSSKDKLDLGKFPDNKNEHIIVYCNGARCWKSYKSAVTLVKAGYRNVYQYRDNGFPGWKAKGYPVD